MNERYVLVEHLSAINTVIHNTFQSTQRIKFTSFDVSSKYIIFGVKSGGIYIFSRESCQFVKLIPSIHGPANLLLISEDEANLAVAVSTGHVLILEDCFGSNFLEQIFTEHEGNTVTALKWNGNDLYCGDSAGKVSVITLKNFLTKAMFQAPVACLMHLDSQIVQLDTHSRFLLVSTLTRTLLCDTETERYRQIGKKARDGRFGACFFDVFESPEGIGASPQIRGTFQTVGENEELSLNRVDNNQKIFCARPGVRLWQADFQADVIFTHQFRPSLNVGQSETVHWDDAVDAELKIIKPSRDESVGDNFSFGQIYNFLNKFIMTFKDDGIYIFEPSSSALMFWKRLSHVKDVKIVKSFLYVWHRDLEVSIMSLCGVEELILKSLYRKQYLFCGQLCVKFVDEVQTLMNTSKKIHLISVLESKLDNRELLEKLAPIIEELKERAKTPTLEKFKSGIVTVTNIATINPPDTPECLQSDKPKKKEPLDIVVEQYLISGIHKNLETSEFCRIMNSLNPKEFHNLITDFCKKTSAKDENCEYWCREIYLKYLNKIQNFDLEPDSLKYACCAFLEVNNSENLACKCNFPLPKAYKTEPKYYHVGRVLIEKSHDYETFLKKVPYMYSINLEKNDSLEEIHAQLPLIIQYSNSKVIKKLLNKMSYDVWDDSIRLLLKLKGGHCLNCGKEIEVSDSFEWKKFGLLMVQSIKATNTLKLLKRYANLLPKGTLDDFFYQYCIFSTVTDINSSIFNEIIDDEGVQKQLESSVGEYLRRKYLNGGKYVSSISNKSSETVYNCDHCQLPLKMPLVEEGRMLNCGHNYHQVCFLYIKKQCTVCDLIL